MTVVSAILKNKVSDMLADHNDEHSGMFEVKRLITLNTSIKGPSNGLTLP